jgi:cyclohexyl-isocyanide hydratase
MSHPPPLEIGILLFPGVTALDAVGPYEPLVRLPGARVRWVGGEEGPVRSQGGLGLHVDTAWPDCPQLDLLLVPGGAGQVDGMEDEALLGFLRRQAEGARWVTSVCTGSLLLGAAGLLRGYRATTHWRYLDCLGDLGAVPVRKRVVSDRNRVTAAGVSAGIDMGLFLAALIAGDGPAREIQLQLEYDPQPAFHAGSPEKADADIVAAVEGATQPLYDRRRAQARRLGERLRST